MNQELLPLQAAAESGGGVGGERGAVPAAAGAALLLRRGRRPLPPLPGRQLHAQQERLRLGGVLPPVLRRRGALGGRGRGDGGGELRVRLEDIQTSEAVSRPRRPPPVPSAETPSPPPRLYIRSDTFTQALNIKTEQSH